MNFSINQPIKIIDEYNDYNANVENVMDRDITITVFDAVEIFTPGETIIIEMTGSDAVYLGQATMIKVIDGARNSSCVLSKPTSFSRMQRREYVRIKTNHKTSYRIEGMDDRLFHGQILDLSGNGLRLSSEVELKPDMILYLEFTLKGSTTSQQMNVKAKVVRQFKTMGGLQYGVLFVDILPVEQDKIVKYILHESVKKRSLSSFLSHP